MTKPKSKSAMASFMDNNFTNLKSSEDVKEVDSVEIPTRQAIFSSDSVMEKISATDRSKGQLHIVTVAPEDCRLWEYADRPSNEMGDISALAESMQKHGQQQPILIRSNTTNTDHKYEVIFGNRRWSAAKHAGIKLTAVKKDLSDKDAGLVQKQENENRKDLSNYARAVNYKAQIDGGVFTSESELAKHLSMSKQTLNDIMSYLRVPKKLRDTIHGYSMLSKNLVIKIANLAKNKEYLDTLFILADDISSGKVTSTNIENKVKNFSHTEEKRKSDVYFKNDSKGKLLYEIKKKPEGKIAITISKSMANDIDPEVLNSTLLEVLNSAKVK